MRDTSDIEVAARTGDAADTSGARRPRRSRVRQSRAESPSAMMRNCRNLRGRRSRSYACTARRPSLPMRISRLCGIEARVIAEDLVAREPGTVRKSSVSGARSRFSARRYRRHHRRQAQRSDTFTSTDFMWPSDPGRPRWRDAGTSCRSKVERRAVVVDVPPPPPATAATAKPEVAGRRFERFDP